MHSKVFSTEMVFYIYQFLYMLEHSFPIKFFIDCSPRFCSAKVHKGGVRVKGLQDSTLVLKSSHTFHMVPFRFNKTSPLSTVIVALFLTDLFFAFNNPGG